MRRWTVCLVFLAIGALILSGCATRGPIVDKQRVVETSGKKGDWVDFKDIYFEKEGNMYFLGRIMDYDLALTRRQAEAIAKKRIAESIISSARTEYEEYARKTNMSKDDADRFVADGVAWTSQNVRISGAIPVKEYWKKVEVTTYDGVEYLYDCYVLIKMSKTDYDKARKIASDGWMKKARKENDRRAEEAAMELKRKLEEREETQ